MEQINDKYYDPISNELFKLIIDFVYKEIINQFINDDGECKATTFHLINWPILFENNNNGIYGHFETKIVYKCYIVYLVNLFSRFLKYNDSNFLLEIYKILYDENLIFSIPYSFAITYEFKVVCFKMMAFLVKRNSFEKNYQELRQLLERQDFIHDINSLENYTLEVLYYELCSILKKDETLKENSKLKSLIMADNGKKSFDEISALNNISFAEESLKEPINYYNDTSSSRNVSKITNQRKIFEFENSNFSNEYTYGCNLDKSEKEEKVFENGDNSLFCSKNNNTNDIDSIMSTFMVQNDVSFPETNRLGNKKELISKRKKVCKWEQMEVLYLVYFVEKIGRSWTEIATKFKHHFNTRTNTDLFRKFEELEKNKKALDELKIESEKICKIDLEVNAKKADGKKHVYAKWNDEESLYLVLGVERFGRNWSRILQHFRKFFKDNRDSNDLCCKYMRLERNPTNMSELKKKIQTTKAFLQV